MHIQPSFNEWFDARRAEFEALVLDVDGVLLVAKRPIPGSLKMLRMLRRRDFPFSLLTNDGNHSVAEKRRHLGHCGFQFHDHEITSCGDGIVEVAQKRHLQGQLFFVMGDLGKPNYAVKAGLRVTRHTARLADCAGVIVGEANYAWEPVINAVFNFFIRHPDRPFIVPNPDEYYPGRRGMMHIAAGGTARFVQHALSVYGAAVTPVYLGKPYQPIFQHNHSRLEERLGRKLDRRRVLMLGDSLASDIRGAGDFGYRSALLLTGTTKDVHLGKSAVRPDFVFRGF